MLTSFSFEYDHSQDFNKLSIMSQSLRGQFLIAGRQLRDPHFYKSVVLIIEHNNEGAMGLVVNRPSTVNVSHALSGHLDLPETDDVVFSGGPVEPAALFILHNAAQYDPEEIAVISDVYIGSSPDVFERILREGATGNQPELSYRIFSGCAGWGGGQLEGEMERGDWLTHVASSESLFQEDVYSIWDNELQSVYELNRILPHSPSNPEWN
ncbi:UPF0301 protein YqgE [hydrothermal vent metagenome]|uniref:UPF0301 protein YqgE n=1 Tax=hydrothermal vent metagenome TaxID=652676 RepID=A0A3B1D4Z2_9ZZZZ